MPSSESPLCFNELQPKNRYINLTNLYRTIIGSFKTHHVVGMYSTTLKLGIFTHQNFANLLHEESCKLQIFLLHYSFYTYIFLSGVFSHQQ